MQLRTSSVDATRALAAALAELVRGGDLLVLAGDLGAGKTAFTQGLGAALGVEGPITSPTFTLARQYDGTRLRLHHLDVYRFDATAEVLDVGLAELLDDDRAVTVIEWGDAILPALPRNLLEVRFTLGEGDDDRDIVLRPIGDSWAARRRALATALDPWSVDGGAIGGAGC
ncbi:tRNA (adenosine(37)-N6)-threonylcarbamoyltransferase complex ATPase subunit type 1 TsaE [Actinomarinicola tropica]|uniref:tRNA threonylcarbamoyladenosine biosynthesis protein TsaE n=1 Tax=Actinomarinicola tropica TaxID=2789776 RepID=A0A5Q2RQT2_9ACTN|nr:tRNA (adenosine(37)-N6)-threonylcarbamoyltransferase complex ATPase subunit type 1 TsaE [Actinomarinicola tropica]